MLNPFIEHITMNKLFDKNRPILLAVSGGVDSVVMLDLFVKSGYSVAVAHCNFQLRKDDSDKDEEFVKKLAKNYGVKFHTVKFDTTTEAFSKGVSIQMAARELRYNWFEKLVEEEKYDYLATAHHKNDVAESVLLNLTKGTGISGLHGILNRDYIVRPLINFSKSDILKYADKEQLEYREDISNADDKYARNLIRNKVIPSLESINPSVVESISTSALHFKDVEEILNQKIEQEYAKCAEIRGEEVVFDITSLKQLSPLRTYLFYFLKDYGFNSFVVNEIILNIENDQVGKFFYSVNYELLRDRDFLILKKRSEPETAVNYQINSIEDLSNQGLKPKLINQVSSIAFSSATNMAYFDFDRLDFPLTLRNWQEGDKIHPFGMKGSKKLSDLFIDKKLSLFEKRNVLVLTQSNGEILWVINHRSSDKFKVTEKTKKILVLESD